MLLRIERHYNRLMPGNNTIQAKCPSEYRSAKSKYAQKRGDQTQVQDFGGYQTGGRLNK